MIRATVTNIADLLPVFIVAALSATPVQELPYSDFDLESDICEDVMDLDGSSEEEETEGEEDEEEETEEEEDEEEYQDQSTVCDDPEVINFNCDTNEKSSNNEDPHIYDSFEYYEGHPKHLENLHDDMFPYFYGEIMDDAETEASEDLYENLEPNQ